MPKAISISKIDGKPGHVYYPLSLDEVPKPMPKARELLIKIQAAALNHRDLFIRQHLYPGTTFGVPLLADGCGTVVATGSDADSSWKGKRVIVNPGTGWKDSPDGPEDKSGYRILGGTKTNPTGTLQEYMVIDESEVEEAPEHLSSVEAAALPLTGLTAWRAVVSKCGEHNLKPGKNILITGIGGGVALMALEFARAAGANVYVSSGSEEKIQKAIKLGAKGGINYKEEAWEKKLLALLPEDNKQLDAIVDGAGGDVVEKGAKLLKAGGIIAVYGMTVGPKMPFLMQAVLKNIEVKGSTMGSRKEFKDMVDFIKSKKAKPAVSRVVQGFDLDAINGLFEDMKKATQFGKLVIDISKEGGSSSKL
ncbi:alcohol dehydrogenase [Exophiala viscosa]|uniref:alcohol dehydrogenase n=1 Tax=Exophiala viscosa TaxID=2486360 RepID=UPI0021A092EF|nr:alcohol dehydrogenase [Exophiala viscosa]